MKSIVLCMVPPKLIFILFWKICTICNLFITLPLHFLKSIDEKNQIWYTMIVAEKDFSRIKKQKGEFS